MRHYVRKLFAGIALAAVGVLAATAVAAGDDDPSSDTVQVGTAEPDKQAEVQGAVESSAPLTNPPDVAHYLEPKADSGPANDVDQVKRDVVSDLQTDRAIMGPSAVPSDLASQLGLIYSISVLPQVVTETATAMLAAQRDPTYQSYDRNTFRVSEWQGVQVSGTTAFAMFLGYDSYEPTGQTDLQPDPTRQWQVELSLEAGRWKLVSQKSVDPQPLEGPGGTDALP
jgi:hypothetical protein